MEAKIGLFSFIGGLIGSGASRRASRTAETAQIAGQQQAIDEQRRQFDITQSNFAPYTAAGQGGINSLADLVGVNGYDAQQAGLVNIQNSPYYESLYQNGEEALLQTASATGGVRGGNTQRALANFGADTQAQAIERQMAQLAGLAGIGQGAVGSVGQFGASASNNISNGFINQGNARASGALFRGGLTSQNWRNAGAFGDQVASAFAGGFGGGGGVPGGISSIFSNGGPVF